MIKQKYVEEIKKELHAFDPKGSSRYFLFGSSVRKDRFHDVDIGIVGNKGNYRKVYDLKDRFYESTFPYRVDIVDFDTANAGFKDYVYSHEPLLWLN